MTNRRKLSGDNITSENTSFYGGEFVSQRTVSQACAEFAPELALPLLQSFGFNPELAREHYPNVALAVWSYKLKAASKVPNPKPVELAKHLDDISRRAWELLGKLQQIDQLVFAASENGPKFQLFVDTFALLMRRFWDDDERSEFGVVDDEYGFERGRGNEAARICFNQLLIDLDSLSSASRDASDHLKPRHWEEGVAPASSGGGPRSPGIKTFVRILAHVWKKATGRPASVRSTARAPEAERGEDPAFVEFVIAVAKSADLRAPTRSMIATALKDQ